METADLSGWLPLEDVPDAPPLGSRAAYVRGVHAADLSSLQFQSPLTAGSFEIQDTEATVFLEASRSEDTQAIVQYFRKSLPKAFGWKIQPDELMKEFASTEISRLGEPPEVHSNGIIIFHYKQRPTTRDLELEYYASRARR